MMVELFVASLALFLWVAVEPGIVRSVAYNILLMGSISTVLFNGNPLLRYDGYYILADLLEIPNLAQRSLQYLGYLMKRHLFGVTQVQPPHAAPHERAWLIGYSEKFPGLRCLMLSGHLTPFYVKRSLEAGARGYVLKDDISGVLEGVERVLNGEIYISKALR